jgi:hypothetical protein
MKDNVKMRAICSNQDPYGGSCILALIKIEFRLHCAIQVEPNRVFRICKDINKYLSTIINFFFSLTIKLKIKIEIEMNVRSMRY